MHLLYRPCREFITGEFVCYWYGPFAPPPNLCSTHKYYGIVILCWARGSCISLSQKWRNQIRTSIWGNAFQWRHNLVFTSTFLFWSSQAVARKIHAYGIVGRRVSRSWAIAMLDMHERWAEAHAPKNKFGVSWRPVKNRDQLASRSGELGRYMPITAACCHPRFAKFSAITNVEELGFLQ